MNFLLRVLLLIVSLLTFTQAAIIDGFSPETNERFANDTDFILDGFNLSGLSRTNASRWLTMISPNVWLSANHFFPGNGSTAHFYATNNPAGPFTDREIISSQQIPGSDLRIGRLSQPLGSSYAHYDFATEPINDLAQFGASPYGSSLGVLVGRSPSNRSNFTDIAFGLNVNDLWFDDVGATGVVDDAMGSFIDELAPPDGNLVPFETQLLR